MPPPSPSLGGLWIPIVTPFHDDGSLDLGSLERLAEHLLADDVAGLVALGTTGESATLSRDERRDVVLACDRACTAAGRGLMVGAGSNDTAATVAEISRLTASTSAHAALVVAPYYTRPSPEGVIQHFSVAADASSVPLVLYNVPYRTGIEVGATELVELSAHSSIVGLKQAVGALDVDTLALLRDATPDFAVLCGDDAFIAPITLMGGAGAIAASAHLLTDAFAALVRTSLAGDATPAAKLAARLLPVVRAGFAEPNPAVFKAVLAHDGVIASPMVRPPLMVGSATALQGVLAARDHARPR